MATISKDIADRLILGGGWFPEDIDRDAADNPQVVRIVEYRNRWGGVAYGAVFRGEPNPFRYQRESQYIQSPKVIWQIAHE